MRGVQRLTVNHRFGKIQFVGPRSQCCGETSLASVQVVSSRVAPVGKVHSDLMGSPVFSSTSTKACSSYCSRVR